MPVLAGVTKEKKVIVETGVDTDMKVKRSGGGGGGEDGEGGETDKGEENAADKGTGGHESSDEEEVGDDDGTDVTRKRERGGGGDIEYDEMEDEEIDLKNANDKDMGIYIEEDDEDSKLNVVNSTELDEGLTWISNYEYYKSNVTVLGWPHFYLTEIIFYRQERCVR